MKKLCRECMECECSKIIKKFGPSCKWKNGILPKEAIKKEHAAVKRGGIVRDRSTNETYYVRPNMAMLIRCNRCNCSMMTTDYPTGGKKPLPGVIYHDTCRNCGNIQDFDQILCNWCGSWRIKSFNTLNFVCTVCGHYQRKNS